MIRPLALWGNRLGKAVIILVALAAVGGTGWLAGHGAVSPEPPRDPLPKPALVGRPIPVKQGDIVSRLLLNATIEAEPPAEVRAVKGGKVVRIYVKRGQRVNKGEPVVAVQYIPEQRTPATPPAAEPKPGDKDAAKPAEPPAPKPVTVIVRASAAGKVSKILTHRDREVGPGDSVMQIDRGRYRAVAPVQPKEVYRLYDRPKSIKLAIDHGPAPFKCPLISYGAAGGGKSDAEQGPGGGGGDGGASVQVSCRVPHGIKVFSGVQAKMSVITDSAEGAILVPTSAVLGQAGKGKVTVVHADGRRETRAVKLGINDGKMVEVRSGLSVGEQILDRAPEDADFVEPPKGRGGPGEPIPMEGKVVIETPGEG
ncbi:peptidase M23 [Bailinhaonella thermotolerans]|uniref:Peptidase M23 n=1 Tax=Bailinhaonella thermotolerans TaxID=1070861 RepID=A0A3A4A7U8_9ACTN|nr:peptidase M23 [Bailinhaonella thermotolerans]RJL22097.1 peptidase M23 [Bailinhaonella thermotolerans]